MNIATFLGFAIAAAIFIITAVMTLRDALVLFNLEAIAIVIGGTIAATLICFPLERVLTLVTIFIKRLFGRNKHDYIELIDEVLLIAKVATRGQRAIEAEAKNIKNLFLRDAAGLLFWAKTEISKEELRDLLETRAQTHYRRYHSEAKTFRIMSKFPPAFGLMGTVLGMIALLQSLGDEAARARIGPSMAIALIATLYGIAFSNFILLPAAENLDEQTEEDALARAIVVEGIMLIQAERPTRYIEEKLRGFLLPKERRSADLQAQAQ